MQTLKDPSGKIYHPQQNKLKPFAIIIALTLAIFVALSGFLYLDSHFAKIISGTSMCPTLNQNFANEKDIVIVNKFKKTEDGDIVIIDVKTHPFFVEKSTRLLVKRVIALGGERIKYIHNEETGSNEVWIKNDENPYGFKLEENYINPDTDKHLTQIFSEQAGWSITCRKDGDGYLEIPDDYVFCMGDNRNGSFDCRSFGPIEASRVMGSVETIVYDGTVWHDILATLFQFDMNF